MELKDFIVSAITDLASAVAEADKAIKPSGGLVNPGSHKAVLNAADGPNNFVAPRTTLNFDIAVSASGSKGGGASGKAKIWVVEASLSGQGETRNETVSRLTFSLDVVLPHDKEQATRTGRVKSG